jgi:hypothetical protein
MSGAHTERRKGVVMFGSRPLVRDVDDARHINVASPTALVIRVRDARPLGAAGAVAGNALGLFAGTIRFGQDGGPTEDPSNELSEYAEADSVAPKTVMLRLRRPDIKPSQFLGAGAFAAFGNVGLTTNDSFGAAVDDCAAFLTEPVEDGNQLDQDLWFFADVKAERASGDKNNINRVAYQATAILALP